MRSTEHGDNLICLTRLWAFNCYLLREDDGLTLIDTGLPRSADQILAAAAAAGAPIRRIVLTHGHQDHVGSLDALVEQLAEVEVLAGDREARLIAGDRRLDDDEPANKLRGRYPTLQTEPTRTLADGDRVGSLEVVATPGHTPGHVAFLDTRDRTLIAGDALQTAGGIAVAGVVRPMFPLMAMGTWSKGLAKSSAVRLRMLEPTRLAVGHGAVLEQPLEAMEEAIGQAD
jgi:glyoxylase-like metal-dependent hydrolase (beta-lactamase superfamily II)